MASKKSANKTKKAAKTPATPAAARTKTPIADSEVARARGMITADGGVSAGELASELGITPDRAGGILRKLVAGNEAKMTGNRRSARYVEAKA